MSRSPGGEQPTTGGFEQIVYAVEDTPLERIADLAARFGCDIFGPPVPGC